MNFLIRYSLSSSFNCWWYESDFYYSPALYIKLLFVNFLLCVKLDEGRVALDSFTCTPDDPFSDYS